MTSPTSTPTPSLSLLTVTVSISLSLSGLACSMTGTGVTETTDATSASTSTTGTTAAETETVGGSESDATTDPTTAGLKCGNNQIDPGEVCDGDDLGGESCESLGDPYIGGDLSCAPSCDAFDASSCQVDAEAAQIKINELLAKGADSGPYADMGDIIELYNAGGASADLSGWKISDELDFPDDKTYVFPEGTTLASGAWLVLVAYDDMTMTGDFPFGISSSNEETLQLANASGMVVDSVNFDGALAEVSLCRIADGEDNWVLCLQTPGEANVEDNVVPVICGDGKIEGEEQCDGDALDGKTCVDVGDFDGGTLGCADSCAFDTSGCTSPLELVLNELSSSDLDPIELLNAGDAAVDLSGWVLTDDVTDPYDPELDDKKLVFVDGTSIAGGAYLVIEKGDVDGLHPFGLGGGGDTVRLMNADLELVDSVTYGDAEAEVSYCRLPNGPGGAWTAGCVATFGDANEGP